MYNVLISGNIYHEDIKHIRDSPNVQIRTVNIFDRIKNLKNFLNLCEKQDLVIFRLVGRRPSSFIELLKNENLLDTYVNLKCKKVFWSQDSHHSYPHEVSVQDYFDRCYIAHSKYGKHFDQKKFFYLPCCYTAGSLDDLYEISAIEFKKERDIGSFYVQYSIGDRNLVYAKIASILKRQNLSYTFARYYGTNEEYPYGNLKWGIKTSRVNVNVSLMDDLNIRNFEVIAMNGVLLTNKLDEHGNIDLDYSLTHFYQRDLSDFETKLQESLDDTRRKQTWISIYNGHCLTHRYLTIINNELGENLHTEKLPVDFEPAMTPYSATKTIHDLGHAEVITYDEKALFISAMKDVANQKLPFRILLELYRGLNPDDEQGVRLEILEEMRSFVSKNISDDILYLYWLFFLTSMSDDIDEVQKSFVPISKSKAYHDFIRHYSQNGVSLADPKRYQSNLKIFNTSVNSIGILNWRDTDVSGEKNFLIHHLHAMDTPVVFDVGANNGSYSDLVKEINPKAVVYAFEPNKNSFTKLKASARKGNYFAFNIGFSDVASQQAMYDYSDASGSVHATLYPEVFQILHKYEPAQTRITLSTIDDFLLVHDIGRIDLLKIDVEGHEWHVLKGATGALGRGVIDCIQFEFNEMNVTSRVFLKDFYDLLPGYSFYRLLPEGLLPLVNYRPLTHEIFAFQNIVAMRKAEMNAPSGA